jgi:hypothetical protein
MGAGMSALIFCFARTQKSCSDFFQDSQLTAGTGGSTRHNKKGCNGHFSKRAIKHSPHAITYLAKAWGIGKNFPLENLKKGATSTKPEKTTNPTQLSVINSLEAAKVHFSAKSLFVANLTHERADQEAVFAYESSTRAERPYEFRKLAKAEWVLAEPKIVDFWEAQLRSKIARQRCGKEDQGCKLSNSSTYFYE